MNKKFAIVLALLLISIVCSAGCIDPQDPVDPVTPVDPVEPVDPIVPVEPEVPEVPAEEYSVMFMLNYDGAGAYTAETVKAGDTVSMPASPSRSGYTFNGWFTAAEGGAEYDFTSAVNSDVMIYAQWKKNKSSGSSHSHKWVTGVTTTEPNCGTAGVKTYTCSCGQTKTESVSATGKHSYAPNTKDGQNGALCSVCGDFKPFVDGAVIMLDDGSSYDSFGTAMENTDEGDVITLVGNVESVDVTQDVIIDLNNQEATLNYGESTPIKILKEGYSKDDVTVNIKPQTVTRAAVPTKTVFFEDDVNSEDAIFLSNEDSDLLTVAYAINVESGLYDTYTAYGLENFANIINNVYAEGEVVYPESWTLVTLKDDIDLYCEDTSESADGDPVTFRPIGDHSKDGTFEGTFDGQGHTISNLYQNGWDLEYEWGSYGSYGLFGNVNDATIKNLVISGAESYIEGGDVGGITGSATGTCVFEDIVIKDSVFATYNNGNGGIIAWSGAGTYNFKNITIADDVVLAGLWGSFDSSIGGIVGQAEPGATYNFKNVDIACRIDAYNDCTASYDHYNYRMCGMIIGRLEETTTIDGSNYPDTSKYNIKCKDVTVTYGEWANYHYCEPTPGLNGGRGMRVEAGYAYDGLPADFDHSQCIDNHMNLIPFDQIFGGDQIAVKGLKTYDGVTVIYQEKCTCEVCSQQQTTP